MDQEGRKEGKKEDVSWEWATLVHLCSTLQSVPFGLVSQKYCKEESKWAQKAASCLTNLQKRKLATTLQPQGESNNDHHNHLHANNRLTANYLLRLLLRLLAHLIYPFLSWAFLLRYRSALDVIRRIRSRRAQTTHTHKERQTDTTKSGEPK